ncbi:hypothetical protein EII25_01950 [Erysipelotrichaceae bacterium OH741_COT-311]|nr:hypothetical protein EII25_01950 [Erysipelotrichaceae bacterium OH741_COT-311]
MSKQRNLVFSILFCAFLTCVGFYVMFVKKPTKRLSMDLRNAVTFIKPSVQNVKEGFFQDTFEKAFQDQFVKRQTMIQVYRFIEHQLYKASMLQPKDYTLVKIGSDVYTFKANEDYLVGWPIVKNDDYQQGIASFSENVNAISKAYPDVNFYVYKPFRITESNWFDKDNGFTSYGTYYRDLLKANLHNQILFLENKIEDFEEYKKYYFKTDPHWNIYGSYEGYKVFCNALNHHYKDITCQQYDSEYIFEDFAYYGQYGRNSSYLTSPDQFIDLNFNQLPGYKTYVNGVEKKYDQKDEFKKGEVEEFFWSYIYSVYHGNDEALVEYQMDQQTGRVLLCFVDSYSSPIKFLIASHFDHAYFVDPRINPDFNFKTFMEEHRVTDVMYMGFYGSLYQDKSYIFEEY